jgi:2-amino-4-hydroxy-6-hydroxymethyldihydropteridine diphosphokinase
VPEGALIALGGNLGDPHARLRQAARDLEALGRVLGRSSLYRTAPIGGPPNQPDYLNAVLLLGPETDDPHALLAALLEVEARHGRARRERWAARTLDLDLLAWDDRLLGTPALTLPHPRLLERPFVLAPLCEVAPDWRHPVTGQSACAALEHLDASGVTRTALQW